MGPLMCGALRCGRDASATRLHLLPLALDSELQPVNVRDVDSVLGQAIEDTEARAYVASGDGRDKAGGYAVQGGAGPFVERIDGSYSNVVGLPVDEVVEALRSCGLI